MKIERDPALTQADLAARKALEAGRAVNQRPTETETNSRSDAAPAATVELSPRSRELHEAFRAAKAAPDVRQDVVDRVRTQVNAGRYQADPAAIARRLIDREA